MTASFLPKPVTGVNGNGMHTNMSIGQGDANLFYDGKAARRSSRRLAWKFVDRILIERARSLPDPQPERQRLSPARSALRGAERDQVASADRPRRDGAHPDRQPRSARIEVRSIAPDANPYMAIYSLLRTGLEGPLTESMREPGREAILPDNIYDAIDQLLLAAGTPRGSSGRKSATATPS